MGSTLSEWPTCTCWSEARGRHWCAPFARSCTVHTENVTSVARRYPSLYVLCATSSCHVTPTPRPHSAPNRPARLGEPVQETHFHFRFYGSATNLATEEIKVSRRRSFNGGLDWATSVGSRSSGTRDPWTALTQDSAARRSCAIRLIRAVWVRIEPLAVAESAPFDAS